MKLFLIWKSLKGLGNARAYKEAKSSLIRFLKDSKSITTVLKFKEITPEFLEKFEVYMQAAIMVEFHLKWDRLEQ